MPMHSTEQRDSSEGPLCVHPCPVRDLTTVPRSRLRSASLFSLHFAPPRLHSQSAESHKEALEAALADSRAAAQRAEERASAAAAEVLRTGALVEGAQSELKAAKAKGKAKAALVQQQEQLLVDKSAALDRAQREARLEPSPHRPPLLSSPHQLTCSSSRCITPSLR